MRRWRIGVTASALAVALAGTGWTGDEAATTKTNPASAQGKKEEPLVSDAALVPKAETPSDDEGKRTAREGNKARRRGASLDGGAGELWMGGNRAKAAEELGVTDTQREKIRALREEMREKMAAAQAGIEEAGKKQVELLEAEPVDEQAVMAAVGEAGKAHTEYIKLRMKYVLLMRAVFTPEQRATMRENRKKQAAAANEQADGPRDKDGEAVVKDRGHTAAPAEKAGAPMDAAAPTAP